MTEQKKRPKIGIVMGLASDFYGKSEKENQRFLIPDGYSKAISNAGGLPILITYDDAWLEDKSLEGLDGLMLIGSDHGLSPEAYVDGNASQFVPAPERTKFEMSITKKFMEKGKPLFLICGGFQLLGVMHGGKLTSDIHRDHPASLTHNKGEKHKIDIVQNTRMDKIFSSPSDVIPAGEMKKLEVNHMHTQGLETTTDQIIVSARSPDGTIEAIELKDYPAFNLAVQFHPELLLKENPNHPVKKVFEAFVHESSPELTASLK